MSIRQPISHKTVFNFLKQLRREIDDQDLYLELQRRGKKIGLATVYRALKTLHKQGSIQERLSTNGKSLYSAISFHQQHHLNCLHCRRSIVIDNCPINGKLDPSKKNISQSILNNVRVGKNLSFRDITVVNNFSEQTTSAKLPVYQHYIPSVGNFVGREELIEEILEAVSNYRAIAILGISGIGKSAVMARIASYLNLQPGFWYKFEAELAFLDDFFLKLAHFPILLV